MNAITRCFDTYWSSSIGKKIVVAVTGLLLCLFLAGHLAGNLLIYAGREAFNDYAAFLHSMLHGAGIWIARIGLLAAVTLHVVGTIALTRQNRAARQPYECKATIQATKSSRLMIWSGLTILAFVIFHLLHFTVRVDCELASLGKDDPYGMVIVGFKSILVSAFYILAITLLCSHLHHGVASIFQTLGLRTKKNDGAIRQFSSAFSLIIWFGFISIPISVLLGFLKF